MKEPSRLQSLGVELLEINASDTWKLMLDLARGKVKSETVLDESINYHRLFGDIRKLIANLSNMATELDCRWALDLTPTLNTDKFGHVRLLFIPNTKSVGIAQYRQYPMHVGTSFTEITSALTADIAMAIDNLHDPVTSLLKVSPEEAKPYEMDTISFNLITFQATNDYLANRLGEDESGIIIYLTTNGRIGVEVYQTATGPKKELKL